MTYQLGDKVTVNVGRDKPWDGEIVGYSKGNCYWVHKDGLSQKTRYQIHAGFISPKTREVHGAEKP